MGRPGMSIGQKSEVWHRWRRGESLSEIGRAVGKHPGSVFGVLKRSGGITPSIRRRSHHVLTLPEREEISRGIAAGLSFRQISIIINKAPSTVSREIKRNGGLKKYRAVEADEKAWNNARRPKICKLAQVPALQKIVAEKLTLKWSPEQISGWLKCKFTHDKTMQVSHETIYRSLYIQSRGVLKKGLKKHLRTGRVMRQSKQNNTKGITRGQIIDGLSIHKRPNEIEKRNAPGHWEGDLIAGSKNTHIATLVERQSRFTILVKLEGKDAKTVTNALSHRMNRIPGTQKKTLTWDRGMELAYHKQLSLSTNMIVYFCDPKSPWQRGLNENTNGLLRQYFPKKTDLSIYSQVDLDDVATSLNKRPRKILGYLTPAIKFWESVALTI